MELRKNILRNFAKRDVYIKVFPFNSTFEELSAWNPDGYFLSNGPGDPEPLVEAQALAKTIIDKNLPLFGICLGHQVIALANGVSTYKMHNGHRGINHPVKNLVTGKGEITSQNHGFAVNREEAEAHTRFRSDAPAFKRRHRCRNCDEIQKLFLCTIPPRSEPRTSRFFLFV